LLTASETRSSAPPSEGDIAVRLQNVSVRYDVPQERIRSLKEYAIRRAQSRIHHREFWALRDVNIEVKQGKVLGIIGRNGAGKSTLLKVISRVMRPTRGSVWVRGRVAPLLELGAGFHSELTGRENIFLNGTLLGHTHRQVQEKLNSIVEFAEIWDFIDAPLRTYSTGMTARLGFSVATAWTPDILILDEILSVGDAAFQMKSAERIQQMRADGATVLMVSHNPESIQTNCDHAVWIDQGRVVAEGTADMVARQYRGETIAVESKRLAESAQTEEPSKRWGTHTIEITRVKILNAQGAEQTIFHTGDRLVLQMDYHAHSPVTAPIFGMGIHRQDGAHITGPNTSFAGLTLPTLAGNGTVEYTVPSLNLLEGLYHISVAIVSHNDTEMFDYHDRTYSFRIVNEGGEMRERLGVVTLNGEWTHRSE
jgi:lipopolysaccharide transport system ATP-binding protein